MRRFLARASRVSLRPAGAMFLLSIAATSLIVSAQTNQLRLVSTAWPPFTNEPGQARFALDLVEAALGRIGLSSSTTIVEAATGHVLAPERLRRERRRVAGRRT